MTKNRWFYEKNVEKHKNSFCYDKKQWVEQKVVVEG